MENEVIEKKCINCSRWQFLQSGAGDCLITGLRTSSQSTCDNFEYNNSQVILCGYCNKYHWKDYICSSNPKIEPPKIGVEIPTEWTFKSDAIAQGFDAHVREQLPFYDLATKAVVHLARHYIPVRGVVYDIGASTGNITMAIADTCFDRYAEIHSIEESESMNNILEARMKKYCEDKGCPQCFIPSGAYDALKYDFEMFDFAVCFLTFMFFPISERRDWLSKMRSLIKPGGALVIVDKVITPPGYAGTALRRLAMSWKLDNGAKPEDIIKKELSLAGYQRPVDERMFESFGSHKFFQLGEFAGWIIERGE
jgi:tRNA (cmo5U34)-methyltransferase